ncbi:MAG: pilus assembly protein CpaE [Pseudonocardiales bacterium]|nr:MAG: pilus assembly protein CpaE [Pseudonocardiales bacterium]
MIYVSTARRLRDIGVRWNPTDGDRFVVADRDMDDEVFVLSTMTVEVHDLPQGTVIGFNGTTEWALDSVENSDAVWLPREGQLREMLGATFRSLSRDQDKWRVDFAIGQRAMTVLHEDAEEAYGVALLALLD